MVQGKKINDMSNGTPKYPQANMAYQRKDTSDTRGGSGNKNESRQNGGFRTDAAISGTRNQGERPLQRWVPDGPAASFDGSIESTKGAKVWDQFAENNRLFGLVSDYDENIYTTPIDKNHPQHKQRLADADRIARQIERSVATNSHIAEERIMNHTGNDENGTDEEDKYSGVHRQQNFPPLPSSNNKYTPPARRAPTGQSTVSGAPVDPAIISSQLARPEKPAAGEKPKTAPVVPKPAKPEAATPPPTTESSSAATPEPKSTPSAAATSSQVTSNATKVNSDAVPNATATIERDVTHAFKGFAAQQRKNVETQRVTRARNDKEIKLNDLKNFANSFKLHTPVPKDLVSIIAKDPKKQKEIQEKAQRNAEEASKASSAEASKTATPSSDSRATQRPTPTSQGSSSSNVPQRQNTGRNSGYQSSFRGPTQPQQSQAAQQNRTAGNMGARLRNIEQNKHSQMPLNPIPLVHEARLPPTGPANAVDPNFSRRSSGVASVQGPRLNPNSNEFRPSPHAMSFSPSGNPSTGSSPRSAANVVAPAPVSRSLLRRKPVPAAQRPSIRGKFDVLEQIKSVKPQHGNDWPSGIRPAYDTWPIWKQAGPSDENSSSPIKLTYTQVFERAPFPPPMSPSNPSNAYPQVPHQHQLPIHLQQGAHLGARQSPRQPPMNMHGNQHHGPNQQFNGPDDHRMMPSHSAQSFASPRLQNVVPMAYPSPMNQTAQMAYNPQMMPYPGAPPMQGLHRSFSGNPQFMPQQGPMGPIMMQNPNGTFLTSQGMAPGPQMMYPGNQFGQPGNGHPPPMPGVNGFAGSPGRTAPMMIHNGSQQGQQQSMYGISPGMNPPGPPFGGPMYPQQGVQMPMRTFPAQNQFGTSPQMGYQHQQQRGNHQSGNYNNNNKNFHQHQNGPGNNQIPTGPQSRGPEGSDETK